MSKSTLISDVPGQQIYFPTCTHPRVLEALPPAGNDFCLEENIPLRFQAAVAILKRKYVLLHVLLLIHYLLQVKGTRFKINVFS